MKPTPLSFASLAFLVFAGWQAVATLSRTPAFNGSLQVEGADGRSYSVYAPAMYDRASYYEWMAGAWDGQGTAANAPGESSVVEEAQRRMRNISIESLRYAPGNPTSWMYLAMAEAGLGKPAAALDALVRAQELTPHSTPRAIGRVVFLTELMEDPEARNLALARLDPRTVNADLRLLADDRNLAAMGHRAWESLVARGFSLSPLPER